MLKVGQSFSTFKVKGVISANITDAFIDIDNTTHQDKWKIFFFWPKDFTFICPTEITEFGRLNNEFENRNAKIYGVSTDSEFVHLAWKQQNPDLSDLPFPMLSDIKREMTQALGILDEAEGVAQRATFIVDPKNIIRFVMVTDLNVGRNPNEVLRVLDALQAGGLTACNWQKGEKMIEVV